MQGKTREPEGLAKGLAKIVGAELKLNNDQAYVV
jgi:hypothetical protein